MNALASHAGKFGLGGLLATITLSEWSAIGGICVAVVTVAAVLPVAILRWRALLNRRK